MAAEGSTAIAAGDMVAERASAWERYYWFYLSCTCWGASTEGEQANKEMSREESRAKPERFTSILVNEDKDMDGARQHGQTSRS